MNPSLIARIVARIAGLSLAAVVTVSVLSGVGHLADSQYRDAALAQATSPTLSSVVVAKIDEPGI